MKKTKILFWATTGAIFIFEGIIPLFTYGSEETIQSFVTFGYPAYFVTMLTVFKVTGSLALIFPQVPSRVKEWAYAGFGIDFIAALVSMWVVGGISPILLLPIAFMIILTLSYTSHHKLVSSISTETQNL